MAPRRASVPWGTTGGKVFGEAGRGPRRKAWEGWIGKNVQWTILSIQFFRPTLRNAVTVVLFYFRFS